MEDGKEMADTYMNSDRTLIYCTNEYPGDLYTEKTFVDSELGALRRHFGRVILVPCENVPREMCYEAGLPEGVVADWTLAEDPVVHSRRLKLLYIFHPFVLRSLCMMVGEARTLRQWAKGLFQALNAVAIKRVIKKVVRRRGLTPERTVLYSLWFNNPAAALGLMGREEGWHVSIRAHSSDIYDHQNVFRSHRTRSFLLKYIERVYPISAAGLEYLRCRFPEVTDKFQLAQLGSSRLFTPSAGEPSFDGRIELLTVARLHPVKRLDLIMEVLANVASLNPDKELCWSLIGDGQCMEALERQAGSLRKPNFHVEFVGALSNVEIQRRLAETPPHWFIMMSYSEGIPISMGEAMSYGVPVISTDVGSVGELADRECGFLFPRDIHPEECALLLSPKIFDPQVRRKLATRALARWEECFNSESLSERFAATL